MSRPTSNRYIRPSNLRVRAPRIPFDLSVESKTIGTSAAYKLATVDISRSGLLLSWERKSKMPFIENTIVEMTIDKSSHYLKNPLTCLGKVVRRDEEDGQPTRLGIQIVQIDNSDLSAWEGCVTELEKSLGIETSNKLHGTDSQLGLEASNKSAAAA